MHEVTVKMCRQMFRHILKDDLPEAPDTIVKSLDDVLAGKVSELWSAFIWDQTPQGHGHWHVIAEGIKRMTPDDVQFLLSVRGLVSNGHVL